MIIIIIIILITCDINLVVPSGKLVCVVGPVGSGKSALVQGLLNELFLEKGSVSVPHSVSYTPQVIPAFSSFSFLLHLLTVNTEPMVIIWYY